MKFKKGTRRKAIVYEKDLVRYWKEHKTFEKSVEQRPADSSYVFYDGPPFLTGTPHHGHLLGSIIKDAIPRYQTMQGHRVERVWGWDCHGLPAEVYTEKKLGIKDKREIGTKISLKDYILATRDNMVQTSTLWEDTIDRIGRWVDFKGAYKTMDKEYMESVWWAFKQLYEKGKIYEGEKVLLYCTRDATPISKAEVAMDNSYQEVTDPSVYVKFKLLTSPLQGDSLQQGQTLQENSSDGAGDVYLLAWTTTPWTLNANTAVVINKNVTYAEVVLTPPLQGVSLQQGQTLQQGDSLQGERLIVAEKLLDKVLTDEKHQVLPYTVVRTFKGSELVGRSYEPLFVNRGENAHKVWHADFVTDEDGTGIAHQAPGYGEDDYTFAKANNVPFVLDTDDEGYYTEGPWKGKQIWETNKEIAKELKEQGVVWKIEYIRHEYPHCHRCGTKLQYRAHPSWFMNVDEQRTEMLEQNGNINWFPEHIKHGRFEKTVESAPDWNLSRDRFWATAMPVWKALDSEGKEHIRVVGSYAELKELSGKELDDYHLPWIDDVTFTLDGLEYKRIDKVLDCWFESGSMPFAQFHYPFENVEKFEANFPGDFIAEYVGQVRAWFYYLHAINVGLFGKNAFKHVIVTGTIAGSDGRKMSKSLGNYTDPNELIDTYSADSLRFLLLSSPLVSGEDFSLIDKDVADVSRKLAMIWNMYDFFTLYADVDNWEWQAPKEGVVSDPSELCSNPLDTWIISRVHQLNLEVTKHMDVYDLQNAIRPILPFVDDASNWFVRRSRKRFWKSEDDADKDMAYQTLHYVLTQLSLLLAPFAPFLAEELYRNLTGKESVHLEDWPVAGHINELSISHMSRTRSIIEQGLSRRMAKSETEQQVKVRQPLKALTYGGEKLGKDLEDIIAEEVNVKEVVYDVSLKDEVDLDKTITAELRLEGLMRELIRVVQSARKSAGLEVDDRIVLSLESDNEELLHAISTHKAAILAETLAQKLNESVVDGFVQDVMVEGNKLKISLKKSH
jgi:isoleucyl-tRNA synthetase